MSVSMFEDPVWQMSWGERAAMEGVLSELRPALAVEIGSMEGASLRRIAARAAEVHSFDLRPPTLEQPDNVTLHTGDSHELLPAFLRSLEEQDRSVDFVLVDGDHSAPGVQRDVEDLLDSRAVRRAVILIHDTANEQVRRGLDAVRFAAWPKVTHVDLDWVPGRLFAEAALRDELWYGLGLVLVDSRSLGYGHHEVYEPRYQPAAPLLALARDLREAQAADQSVEALRLERLERVERELAASSTRCRKAEAEVADLRGHLDRARQAVADITESPSWRFTEPLRSAKRRLGR